MRVYGSQREYSAYACAELEKASYTVWFRFPEGGMEYNLGSAVGLRACNQVGVSYANSKGLSSASNWSHVCCLHSKTSPCAEKHR